MAKFEIYAPFLFSWEGGYVDHPNDAGGATNMGITLNTYRVFCKNKGLVEPTKSNLKELSKDTAIEIYKANYWAKIQGERIENQAIASLMCDWCITSGLWGIKYAQRALHLADDGIIGEQSLKTINTLNPEVAFDALWQKRKWHFEALGAKSGQEVFLKGWLNRLKGIQLSSLTTADNKIIEL